MKNTDKTEKIENMEKHREDGKSHRMQQTENAAKYT